MDCQLPAPPKGMRHATYNRVVAEWEAQLERHDDIWLVGAERLLGKDIAMTADADGVVLAAGGEGKPAPAAPVCAYLAKAFGDRLADAHGAMQASAAALDPDELNRVGFRLYEHFRPEVPEGVKGWGAKGELRLDKIRDAAP